MIAKERLYLTSDKKEVVREGDKRAAFLFASVGSEINDVEAKRYGLVEVKESAPASNKEMKPEANKKIWPAESKRRGKVVKAKRKA